MADRRRMLTGGIVIAIVIAVGALAAATTRRPAASSDPSAEPSVAVSIGQAASGTPRDATPDPTATFETPEVTPSATPTATAKATAKPRTSGDPRLAYAAFLLRANDDRSTVESLNRAVAAGVEDQDRAAVRAASADILDFVDSERDWLREHPPADCYSDAHDAANTMLKAYGAAADRFITWSKAAPGLDSLAALGLAAQAADAAGKALAAFGRELEATTCR
jgi:hypothetical protein